MMDDRTSSSRCTDDADATLNQTKTYHTTILGKSIKNHDADIMPHYVSCLEDICVDDSSLHCNVNIVMHGTMAQCRA